MTVNLLTIIGEVEGLLEAVDAFGELLAIDVVGAQVALQPRQDADPLGFAVDRLDDAVAAQRILLVAFHFVPRCHQGQVVSELPILWRVQSQVHVGDLFEDHGGE